VARIGIVHHTSTGYTGILAAAVARGADSEAQSIVERVEIVGSDIAEGRYANDAAMETLDACDAIVFGAPTYMGAVSAQMKAFLDATLSRWYSRSWSGKIGAAFTVSSTPSGDKLNTLLDIFVCGMQHGMIWVGLDQLPIAPEQANRLGVYVGVAAQPDYQAEQPALLAGDAASGESLGMRVARFAALATRRGE